MSEQSVVARKRKRGGYDVRFTGVRTDEFRKVFNASIGLLADAAIASHSTNFDLARTARSRSRSRPRSGRIPAALAWSCPPWPRPSSSMAEQDGMPRAAPAAAALLGNPEGSEEVERVQLGTMAVPADGLGDLSAPVDVSPVMTDSSLRGLCHDLIELTATIRWLARAAEAGPEEELRNRLGAIAAAAGQIAAICDDILDPLRCCPRVRLDEIAAEAVASAKTRYPGVIDVVSQPVTASVRTGDIVRILCNVLANACRAAGPAGRIVVRVDEADGQARLTIADSGDGLGGGAPGGRAGLGLEIVGALTRKYGGSVHLGVSDLGGLVVTVQVPAQRRSLN